LRPVPDQGLIGRAVEAQLHGVAGHFVFDGGVEFLRKNIGTECGGGSRHGRLIGALKLKTDLLGFLIALYILQMGRADLVSRCLLLCDAGGQGRGGDLLGMCKRAHKKGKGDAENGKDFGGFHG